MWLNEITYSHREHNTITTKKKLTTRGSEYFQRDVVSKKTISTESGGEEEEVDVYVEKGSKSVSQQESHLEAANAKIVPKVGYPPTIWFQTVKIICCCAVHQILEFTMG